MTGAPTNCMERIPLGDVARRVAGIIPGMAAARVDLAIRHSDMFVAIRETLVGRFAAEVEVVLAGLAERPLAFAERRRPARFENRH